MRFNNSQQLTHRYLHSPVVDQVLVDEVFAAGAGGQRITDEVLWQLADHQGTVRDIVDYGGVLRKHVDYDSFGRVTGEQTLNGAAVDQLFYFQGQERDAATGLQLQGARWYDPNTGRWLSEDPIAFAGGDPNLYRYVGNSPDNCIDPTGLSQAGNPLANLNLFAGGYSGGIVSAYNPPSTAIASGFKAIGNSVLSAGVSLVNNVYSAGVNVSVP